ncbi:MAG: TonB-dependent receptor [Bacteroidales bacterium]|nr:TonB-dependent receptor [Bacteroidales bacterium]
MKPFLKKALTILMTIPIINIKAGEPPAESSNASLKLKTLSGYIRDAKNGETLAGATVYIRNNGTATSSNPYGFYTLSLTPGHYTVEFSYVGYKSYTLEIDLKENKQLDIELDEEVTEIEEVVVKGGSTAERIRKPEMSVSKLESKTIKKIPALMGETDLIKAIQLLPGVQPTSEGTSGFSVRGGGIDQNLVIFDDATIYNASHLMGFFSVFNNDIVREVKLYKGDLPANFGGRLSSVLDIKTKDGNMRQWTGNAGIGLISSRLMIEGPIIKDTTSILISGRRTYADIFFPFLPDTDIQKSYMYFYDLNLKITHQFNNRNRIFLSGYLGRDRFGQKNLSDFGFGNKAISLRWNSQLSGTLLSNVTTYFTEYSYALSTGIEDRKYFWQSQIKDLGINIDFNYYPNPQNELRFGITTTYHTIDPIRAWIEGDTASSSFPSLINHSLEHGIYVSHQLKINQDLTIKYGIRYSVFQNMGKTIQNYFDENHNYLYTTIYKSGKIYHTYGGVEPRLGINYVVNDYTSLKASYARTYQYLQLASNSNGGMPLDYWFPASPNIKPQQSDQYAVGILRNVTNWYSEFSVEFFYKDMKNVIDFKDHAQLLFNDRLEGDVRVGNAHSYGAEILFRKNEGRLNGWISYTYSRALRKIPKINGGKAYSAPYDKPHNVYIVLNYDFSRLTSISGSWIYATGTPITFPVGSFKYGNDLLPIYPQRNEYRMRDYHRLDISLTVKSKEKYFNNKVETEWVFSIYNVYGRHNDWMINFRNEEKDGKTYKVAERWYLPFVFFPSMTLNVKF